MAVTVGVDTFVTVAEVITYATARNNTVWADADVEEQERAVREAALYLSNEQRFQYRGTKADYAQRLPFPRTNLTERYGPAIPADVVPWRVKDAQCELALVALATTLQTGLERGGKVQSETIDSLTTAYAPDAPGETVYPAVVGLLQPLLRDTGLPLLAVPSVTTAVAPTEFTAGTFQNKSGLL